jgi:hypothetical protein
VEGDHRYHGWPTVDTQVAQHIIKTILATRLMGADCIISPQIWTCTWSWIAPPARRPKRSETGSQSDPTGMCISRLRLHHGSIRSSASSHCCPTSQIKRGAHRSVADLVTAIQAFIDDCNASPRAFRWVKTADDILASIERFCRRTLDVHAKAG